MYYHQRGRSSVSAFQMGMLEIEKQNLVQGEIVKLKAFIFLILLLPLLIGQLSALC